MDKRHRQPNSQSPVQTSKRSKQHVKLRKTFFFHPQNTLAFNPNKGDHPSSLARTNSPEGIQTTTNTFPNQNNILHERPEVINLDSEPHGEELWTRPVPQAKVYDKSMEQQSSDDSFDGVRWRPVASPNKMNKPILSSPLKKAESASNQQAVLTEPMDNEVTDSVLCKYGVGLSEPLSQTPSFARTRSEGPGMVLETSPPLLRSKSFDPRSLESFQGKEPATLDPPLALVSRLNTWIDKFDVEGPLEAVRLERKVDIPMPNRESSEEKNVGVQDQGSLTDDDPFSDDDSILASIKPELFQQTSVTMPTTANSSTGIADDAAPPESDPFSDDLDLSVIQNAAVDVKLQVPALENASESFSRPVSKLAALLLSSTHSSNESMNGGPKISFQRKDLKRYQIKSIIKGTYPFKNFTRTQLILLVRDDVDQETKLVVRGDFAELNYQVDDIIHVILTAPDTPKLIDNSNNLIIWNPDILVTSTVVADQLFCPRKTVISKRLSFPGEASIPLIVGTTVHEIFQACFIMEKYSKDYLEELLVVELRRRILDIYTMGDVLDDIKNRVRSHFPYILHWFQSYFRKPPKEIPTNKRQQKIKFSVSDALDVEESVWSPMFGIKGIADVTLKANLEGDVSNGQFLLPMEIKTSRQYLSHQAQAALYSLLFKDRYNVDISSFLLVYTLDEGSTTKHDISVPDLKSLINLRNRISYYLQPGRHELPDLMRQQKCDNCSIQQSCMTLNYLTETGSPEDSGLNEGVYENLTSHLLNKPEYAEFYQYWDTLLSKEEAFMARFNKDLWVLTAKERELDQGKALSELIISKSWDDDTDTDGFQYTFKRSQPSDHAPMDSTQISKYDKIIVSDQSGHFALAQGFVRHIEPNSITVSTRRRIIATELKTDKFHRAGVLRSTQLPLQTLDEAVVFRIDKDEISYGMGVARYNILNLFLASGDDARRRLVVDLDTPRYLPTPLLQVKDSEDFNPDQVAAIKKVLLTKDYSLILGMPGTGKTTVIAYMIKMLVEAKKSVLLTSYTNSAVDNILLKVKAYGVDFLRIGNPSRIHQDIRSFIPGEDGKKVETFSEFSDVYMKPYVVASTCLSIRDLAFNVRDHFDYCIVDEASQVSMPLSLGPLSYCDKFVLVGDHFQLPPLVTHPNAEVKKGLSKSLFQILAEAHPQSVVELTYQYRMSLDIMLISNALVYQNRLKCGSESVAGQALEIPNEEELQRFINPNAENSALWLSQVFHKENRVLFLNHDNMGAYERMRGENVCNLKEVELTRQMVEALCLCGVKETNIGVMTLYRSQLKLLVETFRHRPLIEILTADRFQGRDKECIIISLVRSNKEQRSGDLLKDWRRVNVAVTRARSKLIVLGSLSTLQNAESIKDFIELVKKKKWICNLDKSSLSAYEFKRSVGTSKHLQKPAVNKISSKIVGRHPIVRDILSDMKVN